MSVEMTLSRETLCFERLALAREEQVSVEGEATLPGSMRDAVTVLSVQAQAYLEDARATAGGMTLRGHVSFQALYTQGDLTRIRAMETTCDFEHSIDAPELQPDMRVNASVAVQETEGTAASGRMTLRALLDLQIEAFETTRQALVTDAAGDADALRTRMQRVAFCRTAPLGEEKTLVREEFDLPARLEVGDVLSATGEASVSELTGGAGRIGICGTVEVRVLHKAQEAGDPLVMAKTVARCREAGVHVGAHPGFPDLMGFGRRSMNVSPAEAKAYIQYQLGALAAFCRAAGVPLRHVKPHGALYNMAAKDEKLARAIVEGICEVDDRLILLALSGSEMLLAAEKAGLRAASEVFADRGYQSDGTLVPRTQPGAMITDETLAIERVVRMVTEGVVTAIDGTDIPLRADSICVHGDGEKALLFVRRIRAALEAKGVALRAL